MDERVKIEILNDSELVVQEALGTADVLKVLTTGGWVKIIYPKESNEPSKEFRRNVAVVKSWLENGSTGDGHQLVVLKEEIRLRKVCIIGMEIVKGDEEFRWHD